MRQLYKKTDLSTSGGIVVNNFFNIANSSGSPSISTSERQRGIDSFFASASLAWDNLVYLDLTARNDWSSTLPKKNNSYFYPSAFFKLLFSDAINISDAINFGKLRVSLAQAGNDANPYLLEMYMKQLHQILVQIHFIEFPISTKSGFNKRVNNRI